MSRILHIARREYLAYVRTVGFWLSMLLMPTMLALASGAPVLMERSAPIPRLAIVDLTGRGFAADVEAALERDEPRGRPGGGRPLAQAAEIAWPAPPRSAAEAGRLIASRLEGSDPLDAGVVIHGQGSAVAVDLWTRSLADPGLRGVIREAVAERLRSDRLRAAGVPPAEIAALDAVEPRLTEFSPRAEGGQVQFRDRLPGMLGFGLGMALWAMILSGAGILLNSVIEEKSSRILEILLASASAGEIMLGKVLGVAGVTVTVLGAWAAILAAGLIAVAPGLAADLGDALTRDGLAAFFLVFLLGGYLMYASLFAAIGSFCETNREAQTLLAPLMVVMSVPIVFMGQAISRPEAPLLEALSWFPPFTPFLMPTRAAGDVSVWQMAAAAVMTAVAAGVSLWASIQAFRAGALSSGKADLRSILSALGGRAGEA